jgi:hypothetical protein
VKKYLIFVLSLYLISNFSFAGIWPGKYLQVSGKNILTIDWVDEEEKMLTFDIRNVGNSDPHTSFLAFFNKDLATTTTLHNDSDCQLKLNKSKQGIFVSVFCGEGENDTGFYQKTDDFSLSLLTLPLPH